MPSLPEAFVTGVRDIELTVEDKNERDSLLSEQPAMKFLCWTPQLRLFFLRMVRKYGVVTSRRERIKNFIALSRGLILRAKLGSSILSGQTLSQKYASFLDLAKREMLRVSNGKSITVKEVAGYLPKLAPWEKECIYSLAEERGLDLNSFNPELSNRIFILGNLSDLSPAAPASPTQAVLNEVARLQAKQVESQGYNKVVKDASLNDKAEEARLSGWKRKFENLVMERSTHTGCSSDQEVAPDTNRQLLPKPTPTTLYYSSYSPTPIPSPTPTPALTSSLDASSSAPLPEDEASTGSEDTSATSATESTEEPRMKTSLRAGDESFTRDSTAQIASSDLAPEKDQFCEFGVQTLALPRSNESPPLPARDGCYTCNHWYGVSVIPTTNDDVSTISCTFSSYYYSSLSRLYLLQAQRSLEHSPLNMLLKETLLQLDVQRRMKKKLKVRNGELRKALRFAREQARQAGYPLKLINFAHLLEDEIITDSDED